VGRAEIFLQNQAAEGVRLCCLREEVLSCSRRTWPPELEGSCPAETPGVLMYLERGLVGEMNIEV